MKRLAEEAAALDPMGWFSKKESTSNEAAASDSLLSSAENLRSSVKNEGEAPSLVHSRCTEDICLRLLSDHLSHPVPPSSLNSLLANVSTRVSPAEEVPKLKPLQADGAGKNGFNDPRVAVPLNENNSFKLHDKVR